MIWDGADKLLIVVAAAHALLGLASGFALALELEPILGVHPAMKPMKFGASIAVFLATMALLLPRISLEIQVRRSIAWILTLTMIAEMLPIVVQSIRGVPSHFNRAGTFNEFSWKSMVAAIVIATTTMVYVTLIATFKPLSEPSGVPLGALETAAWRAGLWLFLLAAVSGFAMGGRLSHSVGGTDGGPGLSIVGWSKTHGDLRVSHFFSMHALQTLPLIAGVSGALPLSEGMRWGILTVATVLHGALAFGSLLQAWLGRPF